jgi:hypothetical protein
MKVESEYPALDLSRTLSLSLNAIDFPVRIEAYLQSSLANSNKHFHLAI